jgi:polyisoprenyl-phosphate glycosyltransferase
MINKKVSIVIPCYNEEGNVDETHRRLTDILSRTVSDHEIIFTDNKSTDSTRKLIRDLSAKDSHVVGIFFSRNFGNSQYGYSAGTEHASGDAVIWMEGDLQDPPEMVAKLIEKWNEGYDIVYGVRPVAAGSGLSRIGRQMFYRLFKKLSYLDIPRDAGDFSIMDRKVVDVINAMPERSRFVRGLRAWAGFRHIGIEYKRAERIHGVTSNPSFRKNLWWAKKFIFSFSHAPLEFISNAAYWLLLIAVPLTLISILFVLIGVLPVSWTLLYIVIVWLLIINFLGIAILGETQSIIFEEVKGRPKYIIEEIVNAKG